MKQPRIPMEQWLAFKTVVDCGSYALAAEALNKSQSSVSYAVSRLNHQLPEAVLEIKGRKAELTEAGAVLYRYASQLIKQARTMEDLAASMAQEFEAEVIIALDVLLAVRQLSCSLESFSQRFPHTRVRILETSLSGTTEALIEKQANLVIGATVPVGFAGDPICTVSMVPVAAPAHPLIAQDAISEMELKSYRQVVLRDSGQRGARDAGWLGAEQRWTVSHFSSSISIIKAGLAFGFLPLNWIDDELQQGALKEIPLSEGFTRSVPLYLMFSTRDLAGPATRALAAILSKDLAP